MANQTTGAPLPAELVAALLDLERPAQLRFTKQVTEALGRVAPELVPRLYAHPLADEVLRGIDAFPGLLARAAACRDDAELAVILDAIDEIIRRAHPTAEVVRALEQHLSQAKTPAVAEAAARGLARAREPGFVGTQAKLLADPSPTTARTAARLVGIARHADAVPQLLAMLRPDNLALADDVAWALGEIGEMAAAPKLERMLEAGVAALRVAEALGKIGSPSSVPGLLRLLSTGDGDGRRAAAKALATMARRGDGWIGSAQLQAAAKAALDQFIDRAGEPHAVFYAVVAYSLMGGQLPPARILRGLGGKLDEAELGAVSAFFVNKP